MTAHLRLVAPRNVNRTVPVRPANALRPPGRDPDPDRLSARSEGSEDLRPWLCENSEIEISDRKYVSTSTI